MIISFCQYVNLVLKCNNRINDIKIFYKKCSSFENCEVIQSSGNLESELKKKILAKAALYAKLNKEKKKKDSTPYVNEALKTNQ